MPEPVSRTVYNVVQNMLTILAAQGDVKAIEALKRAEEEDVEIVDDDEDGDLTVVIGYEDGDFLITDQGATLIPKPEE